MCLCWWMWMSQWLGVLLSRQERALSLCFLIDVDVDADVVVQDGEEVTDTTADGGIGVEVRTLFGLDPLRVGWSLWRQQRVEESSGNVRSGPKIT